MVELVTQPTVILLNPDDSVLKNIAPETVFLGFRQCWLDDLEKFINEDLQDIPQEKRLQFIIDRMEEGHESPIEHASITFLVKDVSRVESHQHVRHRIASYSQKSQRYVDHQNMRVIVPPTIQKNPVALRVFTGIMDKISEALGELVELGIPKEDARFVLPNATETSLVVTMNLRALKNFFNERCCSNAQWEIRSVANEMLRQLRERSPLFDHFGPKCLNNGFCKENKKRWCGRAPHIEDVMRNHKEMESLRKENEAKKCFSSTAASGSVVLVSTTDMALIDMKTVEPGCVYFAQVVRSADTPVEVASDVPGTRDIHVLVNPEREWEHIGTMETSALQKLNFNPVQMDSFEELEKVPVDERFLRVFIAPVRDTDDPYSDGEAPIGKFVWDTINDQWLPVDLVGTITESK